MSLQQITFDNNPQPKIAILLKARALKHMEVLQHYVQPLVDRGIHASEIIGFSLEYNQQDKAPVKLIREHWALLEKVFNSLGITHVLIGDATYFKVIAKVKKAEGHFGYVLPTIYAPVRASLTINWQQLFFNPSLVDKLNMGIEALIRDIKGEDALFEESVVQSAVYTNSLESIKSTLNQYLTYDALTLDIETKGLHLKQGKLLTVSLAYDEHNGAAFDIRESGNQELKEFLTSYTGTLIYHGSTFDIGRLVWNLFMKSPNDYGGMLEGLDLLFRDMEDTYILAYLATNNTSQNSLSLKDLAFEYVGNYALGEDIKNPEKVDPQKLMEYNLLDTLATWYTYNKYRPIVKDTQESVYQNIFKPALKVITQMELCGMPLHSQTLSEVTKELRLKETEYLTKLLSHPIITTVTKELRLSAALVATSKLKKLVKTEEDFKDLEFNPNSNLHMRHLLFEHLQLPILSTTDTGLPATDDKALTALENYLEKLCE